MKVLDQTIPAISFERFCEDNGISIEIGERSEKYVRECSWMQWPKSRYHAAFRPLVETRVNGGLLSQHGNGATKQAAIDDLANSVTGVTLVMDAFKSSRKEIRTPNEWEQA